jgi:hypothetical protein
VTRRQTNSWATAFSARSCRRFSTVTWCDSNASDAGRRSHRILRPHHGSKYRGTPCKRTAG